MLANAQGSCVSPTPFTALESTQTPLDAGHRNAVRSWINGFPDAKREARILVSMSVPIIATYVLELLPSVVSVALVGKMDSPKTKEYVDAATLSIMFMNLAGVAVGFGLATAMDTLCAQAFGAGKAHLMGIYLQSGLLVMAFAMVPVFFLNWNTEWFLLALGQPEVVSRLAGQFSRLCLPSLPFLFVYELVKKILQAQNVFSPMVHIAFWSNVVNIALGCYLTWYTPLGFAGAAIARSVASAVLILALFPYFSTRKDLLTVFWTGVKPLDALKGARVFLQLGLPGMFMIMLEWWSYEVIAVFVGLLPEAITALSVHSVLVNVSNVTFNFFMGIAVATSVRVGNLVGGGQPNGAKMVAHLGLILALMIAVFLSVIVLCARHSIPRIFINNSQSITLGGHALLFLLPFQLVDSTNCVHQGIFRGTGRQTFAAVINLIAYYMIGLPCAALLAFLWHQGVEGCWIGLTGGVTFATVVSFFRVARTNWDVLAREAFRRTNEHDTNFSTIIDLERQCESNFNPDEPKCTQP